MANFPNESKCSKCQSWPAPGVIQHQVASGARVQLQLGGMIYRSITGGRISALLLLQWECTDYCSPALPLRGLVMIFDYRASSSIGLQRRWRAQNPNSPGIIKWILSFPIGVRGTTGANNANYKICTLFVPERAYTQFLPEFWSPGAVAFEFWGRRMCINITFAGGHKTTPRSEDSIPAWRQTIVSFVLISLRLYL